MLDVEQSAGVGIDQRVDLVDHEVCRVEHGEVAVSKITFEDNAKGSIEKGKLADLVVLSADYLEVPVKQIDSLKALATMVGGRFVYEDPTWR